LLISNILPNFADNWCSESIERNNYSIAISTIQHFVITYKTMSNTSKGPARKGSKFQMQRITLPENKIEFDKYIQDELNWISPVMEDNFVEYRMNSKILLERLNISPEVKKQFINSFWPSPQPQWDGIAWGQDKVLYLFEAKSHISEIQSAKEGNPKNDQLKYESIMKCAKTLFGIDDTDNNRKIWCKKYYQISNRIAFANRLKDIKNAGYGNFNRVILIFLNFINDRTWEKDNRMVRDIHSWDSHYEETILPRLGINKIQLENMDMFIKNFDLNLLLT